MKQPRSSTQPDEAMLRCWVMSCRAAIRTARVFCSSGEKEPSQVALFVENLLDLSSSPLGGSYCFATVAYRLVMFCSPI